MWSDRQGTCLVHQRLEGDVTPRPVRFCRICSAWMCQECYGSPVRRLKAAIVA